MLLEHGANADVEGEAARSVMTAEISHLKKKQRRMIGGPWLPNNAGRHWPGHGRPVVNGQLSCEGKGWSRRRCWPVAVLSVDALVIELVSARRIRVVPASVMR
jgi:hypothetical protein